MFIHSSTIDGVSTVCQHCFKIVDTVLNKTDRLSAHINIMFEDTFTHSTKNMCHEKKRSGENSDKIIKCILSEKVMCKFWISNYDREFCLVILIDCPIYHENKLGFIIPISEK